MSGKKSIKQNFKNTWFFLLFFIPCLQWIPFFMMNGRVPKKRWLMLGFVNIAMLVVWFSMGTIADSYYDQNRPEMPEGMPKIADYLGDYYWEDDNYMKTPEYAEYDKAYDAWIARDDYKAYEKESDRVYRRRASIDAVGTNIGMFGWLIFMILGFFVERYKYLKALAVNQNRSDVYGQLAGSGRMDMDGGSAASASRMDAGAGAGQMDVGAVAARVTGSVDEVLGAVGIEGKKQARAEVARRDVMDVGVPEAQPSGSSVGNVAAGGSVVSSAAVAGGSAPDLKIDINTATEEDLMKLPGMKTIDAKRIIDYRSKNGRFDTLDEFFGSFEVKPHIMVKMEKLILLEEKDEGASANAGVTAGRRFDF